MVFEEFITAGEKLNYLDGKDEGTITPEEALAAISLLDDLATKVEEAADLPDEAALESRDGESLDGVTLELMARVRAKCMRVVERDEGVVGDSDEN